MDPRHVAAQVGRHEHRYRATAPYGLVRLAETPLPAACLHPDHDTETLLRAHDRTVAGTHTGWIDLTLTTLTPTFVGQTRKREGVARSTRLPHTGQPLPTIPGSTLRGLIRNTVRMLTGGESGPVNTPMLFFRAPIRIDPDRPDSSLSTRTRHVMARQHTHYRKRRSGLRTMQGFLYRSAGGDGWYIVDVPATVLEPEPGRALKVSFSVLRESVATWDFGVEEFPDPPRGNAYVPTVHEHHGRLQHRWVYAVHLRDRVVAVAPTEAEARTHPAAGTDKGGVIPALLVLTGAAAGERRNAYLFPRPPDPHDARPVSDALVELFESAEQITGYQRAAFPDTLGEGDQDPIRPPAAGVKGGGLPRRALEPVWFDVDPSGRVVSFGRSGGYRIAVGDQNPVRRAVPEPVLGPQHGDPDRAARAGRMVDACRAMFGDTDVFAGEAGALKGRVFFGNAVAEEADADLTDPDHPNGTVLRVRLLSPQRGCFANYLVQGPDTTSGDRPDIVTWSHEGSVRLGGYKVYLHRHRPTSGPFRYDESTQKELGLEVLPPGGAAEPPRHTQRDIVPLRDGLVLRSRITFTNLTDAELGALMWALLLDNPVDGGEADDPEHAHKVGMGKALGMGSVHLRPELYLVDRGARAADTSLRPDAGVARATDDRVRSFLDAFSTALVGFRLPGKASPERRHEVDQMIDVCLATRWRWRLPWEETAVMSLREFAEYPVLSPLVERFRAFGP